MNNAIDAIEVQKFTMLQSITSIISISSRHQLLLNAVEIEPVTESLSYHTKIKQLHEVVKLEACHVNYHTTKISCCQR